METSPNGTLDIWPDSVLWSWSFLSVVDNADAGGASFTEVYNAAQAIRPGDSDSWYQEWFRIASVCEERGRRCEEVGNFVSARNFYQRSSRYYKEAGIYSQPFGDAKLETERRHRDTFARASRWFSNPVERIEIPYEGHLLNGYFMSPVDAAESPFPTLLWLMGGDETPEVNYFNVGKTMTEAGFGWMSFNHPGIGEALYEKRLPLPYDSERFVTPAVDYLCGRSDVDSDRIVLAGMSLGGHTSGRAAAREHRLAAAILIAPQPDMSFFARSFKRMLAGGSHMAAMVGASSPEEVPEILAKFDWNNLIPDIDCALFCLCAAGERIVPNFIGPAIRVYDGASSETKKLVYVEPGGQLGGAEHCSSDNRHVLHESILNWLLEIGVAPKHR